MEKGIPTELNEELSDVSPIEGYAKGKESHGYFGGGYGIYTNIGEKREGSVKLGNNSSKYQAEAPRNLNVNIS